MVIWRCFFYLGYETVFSEVALYAQVCPEQYYIDAANNSLLS